MKQSEVLVIGGGPAGLSAALGAASLGAQVLLCERGQFIGGQLRLQTQKLCGLEQQYAGGRGVNLAKTLAAKAAEDKRIEIWASTPALGYYEDGIVTCLHDGRHEKIRPERTVIASGAAEKFLAFAGNDLPGIISAGAAQRLMHEYGVLPGERTLVVGSGNIGLLTAYQLRQAGVEVAALIETRPQIAGYLVHAARLRRCGVAILTGRAIVQAYGENQVAGAKIAALDERGKPIPETVEDIACDLICLAAGFSPLAALCRQAGCAMAYIPELEGYVPLVNNYFETTVPGIYIAGSVGGYKNSAAALAEGKLAGLTAALSLGRGDDGAAALQEMALDEVGRIYSSPSMESIRRGWEKLTALGGGCLC